MGLRAGVALRLAATVGCFFALPAVAQLATVDVALSTREGGPATGQGVGLENPATHYSATATTNAQGRARFTAVPAADGYLITVAGQALARDVQLRANETRAISVTLPLPTMIVTARRAANEINAINAEVSAGLAKRELQDLPVEARDLFHALIRLPNVVPSTGFFAEAPPVSINGANGLFAQYLIDGLDNNENFLGGPKFPISTGFVQDVTVLSSSYSVEYGRTGNGVVNVTSKSGTNDWAGEAFYLMRPGQPLDGQTPYPGRDLTGNTVKDGFQRNQYGLGLGGPIVEDSSFFYGNVEYTKDNKDNVLSSPALGVTTTVPGENSTWLVSGKIDQKVADNWRVWLRINHGDSRTENQGGGLEAGVTFPSAGSTKDRESTLAAVAAIYDGDTLTSETNVGWYSFRWNYGRPLNGASPQVTVQGPDGLTAAVLGNPGFVFDELEKTWQLQQKFTLQRGAHVLRFGVDLMRSDFTLNGGGNPEGNYTVSLTQEELDQVAALNRGAALNVDDIPATATVLDYGVELRPAKFGRPQDLIGVYVEDQVALTPALTATLGLRWDYDSVSKAGAASGDENNIAPRLGMNYGITDTVALRGGAGLFYEKLPYTVSSDSLQQNTTSAAFRGQLADLIAAGRLPVGTNLDRVTFDGNLTVNPDCDTYLACPTGETQQNLRDTAVSNERRIFNPQGLDNPYTWQFSFGPQWQVTPEIVATADLLYARGHKLLRLRDVNAPAPFTPNLANLTDANIALLRAQPTDADRRTLAESLGLIRSPGAADTTRPVAPVPGGATKIVVSETAGESKYWALNLGLTKQPGEGFYGYALSYTWSKLRNNTDDINFRASNSNDFDAEWGPSINDRRHVISAVLYLYPLDDLTLSIAGLFQSGQPINLIPDTSIYGTTDLNGDGASFSDAYLGNSDRAPGVSRNSDHLGWSKSVDLGLRYAPRLGGGRVELSADVFNVFDTRNLSGFANSATQSNQIQVLGQPFTQRNAGAPRQFQFGLRYFFE